MTGAISRAYYPVLANAGARIYEFRGGLLHAKTLVADEALALVGSANMDRRSFELNSEVTLLIYDADMVRKLRGIEQDYRANSERLDAESWEKRGFATQLAENIMRLISPLM